MGRKKGHLVALKPFCYYCDKEFNNELILHQHQKARHFNCAKCRKRFSTAPALDTHEMQVHRSSLKRVPNAKAGRDSFELSIYGMDGVPIELINYKLAEKVEQKRRKLIKEKKLVDNEEKKESLNYLDMKIQKDRDIRNLLQKTSELGGEGFYHNPDSINLTLKQNQMQRMFINRPQNNNMDIYGNSIIETNNDKNIDMNINNNINKDEKKKDKEIKEKKNNSNNRENNKDKDDKKNDNEYGILSLEQFNKELD